ncbi:MAG: glycoside hydrolase family 3 protein, partial [Bacteroidota bacterium]
MKSIRFVLLFSLLWKFSMAQDVSIDSLIAHMTVEEKVGQMTQVDLGMIAKGNICQLEEPRALDTAKLRTALERYHVGSVLNVGCGSGTIALDEWRALIGELHSANRKYSRTGIPILYGIDAIHGANYVVGATLFPQPIGQAATWNPDLIERLNAITAYETRAAGIPWNFSPVLDIGRQPLWSRFFETYGEDVLLASDMSDAAVRGLQGKRLDDPYRVAACMKHFLGYSAPISGRDRTPAWIGPRELREYFLPTFQAAIAAGARTVMINSGEINGTPVHADRTIVTDLLRDELGFTGVAVTDWEDIYKLVDVHHVAADRRSAVKMAIDAGIDMSMTPNDFGFTELLVSLVKSGEVSEKRIDMSVRRILQLKKKLGLFRNVTFPAARYDGFASKANAEAAYQTACESIT